MQVLARKVMRKKVLRLAKAFFLEKYLYNLLRSIHAAFLHSFIRHRAILKVIYFRNKGLPARKF
jgi:hypothetical protein